MAGPRGRDLTRYPGQLPGTLLINYRGRIGEQDQVLATADIAGGRVLLIEKPGTHYVVILRKRLSQHFGGRRDQRDGEMYGALATLQLAR